MLTVPTWEVPAKVVARFGSEPTIASDNGYADLDGDALPDLAVGRLTADTPAELAGMVGKILAYERSVDFGPWRRNVNLMAGLGGFGAWPTRRSNRPPGGSLFPACRPPSRRM